MSASNPKLTGLLRDFALPVLIALTPFIPNAYEWLIEPDIHFVYDSTYTKNPVIAWNRQIENLLTGIEGNPKPGDVTPPKVLLRKIGKEVYEALPAMLAGAGFKPMDSKTVRLINLSKHDLKNVRVHFTGCIGYDSYETWPDATGSAENRNIQANPFGDTVTIRYDAVPRAPRPSYSPINVRFFGADASKCRPTVEAELSNGNAAVGKETNVRLYVEDRAWETERRERLGDLLFKVFLAVAVVYLYLQLLSIRRKVRG